MEKIALLTNSYISRVLLETLEDLEIPVFAENGLENRHNLNFVTEKEAAKICSDKNAIVYFNAEDSISFIKKNSRNEKLKSDIGFFKDKFAFKKAVKNHFPEIFFEEVRSSEFESFNPDGKELIVKPSIGFHSVGIRRFSGKTEWKKIQKELLEEVNQYSGIFDENVLSNSKFLVEEYIEGEEFACDAFFNSKGEPIVLSISKHPFKDKDDTRDLVYYTNRKIIEENLPKVKEFLEIVRSKNKLKNFPVHFEFRVKNEKLYPIEVNPLRFGGFGLADLPFHAFGINSYKCFFTGEEPGWEKILSKNDNKNYAFIVGQRPENFNPKKELIDVKSYKSYFKEILEYVPIDPKKYKFFSTTFSRSETLEDLIKFLFVNFNQFSVPVKEEAIVMA